MTSFRFTLEKVLEWRRTQLDLEEVRYRQQAEVLAGLERSRFELEAAASRAEAGVRSGNAVEGSDLAALDSFRKRLLRQGQEIDRQRAEGSRKLDERQKAMLEARRRYRLLERLRERRLAEWRVARDREVEQTAAESYLARFARRQSNPYNEVHDS